MDCVRDLHRADFPHLKKCGPIEASVISWGGAGQSCFPHLKKCGPIEAPEVAARLAALVADFPHLKKCGPIEAKLIITKIARVLFAFRT